MTAPPSPPLSETRLDQRNPPRRRRSRLLTNGKLTLHVTEMMGGFNPTNLVWIGDHNITLTLHLPANAQNIVLGQGLAEANSTIANINTITRAQTHVASGPTEYDFGYTLPVTDGTAHTLTFTLPADTTLFALYLPASFKIEKKPSDSPPPPPAANTARRRRFRQLLVGKHLKAGEQLTVEASAASPRCRPPAAPITLPGGEGSDTPPSPSRSTPGDPSHERQPPSKVATSAPRRSSPSP